MNKIDVEKTQARALFVPAPEEMIDQQNKLVDSQVEVFVQYCLAELKTQQAKGKIIGEVSFCNNQPHILAKAIEIFVRRGWQISVRKRLFKHNPSLVFAESD